MNNTWSSFTEYIVENYEDSEKIVEIGVGKVLKPSSILKEKLPKTEIVTIDINPSDDSIVKDDITHPNYNLYKDTDLIYSIRPPEELQPYILDLSIKMNSDLIIKPVMTEEINFKLKSKVKLVNYKKMVFYILKQ